MAPEIQGVVRATQTWLRSSWHVQVPFAWLEACVQWLQEEGGGVGRLSQQHINQQVLDQWLLTDLRDLDHPVLPEGLSQAQKTELSGTFCVQVDSLLDISQPAYGQLQKWRGTDCTNEEVSAVTQTTQRPWEAKPNRMLLLQVTDGVQSLEAMEYQPIPALSTALRPGVKLQLQGQIVCRLGMLLLGPTNVKVLGGEVEDLVDRNSQGKMLCRALGLPEEEQQDGEEGPAALPDGNQEAENMEPDDQELLASLEAQEDVERVHVGTNLESGYGTLSETSSRSSSVRSHVSTASSRSEVSIPSYRSGSVQNNRGGSVQSHRWGNELDDSDLVAPIFSSNSTHQDVTDYSMADEDFPDEDFDDLPLDELDSVIFHENTNVTPQPDSILRSRPLTSNRITANSSSFDRATKPQTDRFDREPQQQTLNGSGSRLGSGSRFSRQDKERDESCTKAARGQLVGVTSKPYLPSASSSSHDGGHFPTDDERHFMDEDMDSCFPNEIETYGVQTGHQSTRATVQEIGSRAGQPERLESMCKRPQGLCQSRLGTERVATKSEPSDSHNRLSSQSAGGVTDMISIKTEPAFASSHSTIQSAVEKDGLSVRRDPQCDSSTVPTLSLTSPPFSYLCLLQEWISKPHQNTIEICIKAFIVTLLGKLTSSNGVWRVCATVSDGTGYLDVELSDEVLTGLLGFSVAEKAALKRDPARRGELDTGMKRCQEELVDMCCVMTIVVEPQGRKAVVTKADPVTENMLQALEQRVRDRRK